MHVQNIDYMSSSFLEVVWIPLCLIQTWKKSDEGIYFVVKSNMYFIDYTDQARNEELGC